MARAIAVAFLWGFALVFISLTIMGCAKDPYDWGALSKGVKQVQEKTP